MLFKKLYIPINLPLTQDKEFELNNSDLEIVRDIRKANKFNLFSTIELFKNYFNNTIS